MVSVLVRNLVPGDVFYRRGHACTVIAIECMVAWQSTIDCTFLESSDHGPLQLLTHRWWAHAEVQAVTK